MQATVDEVERFPGAAEALAGRDAEGLELLVLRADADAEVETSARGDVDRGDVLATRSGLWNGMQMIEVPMRRRSVRAAIAASMTNGEDVPEAKQKWCSPTKAESKPSFSAMMASLT